MRRTRSCPILDVPNDSSKGMYLLTIASADSCGVNDCIPCVSEDLRFLAHGFYEKWFKLVSHCNGIICFYDYDYEERKNNIFLLNPALKELKVVPNAHFGDDYAIRGVGFDYDSKANDYKVVTIE
ncbi:hypothetical protein L484_001575 [Morus notabilis]|uniref:F-box associated beta-propeller type 1 domain-containing protein n=1 Tax=Morus notabilis TaxID=981085 RepID=W9S1R8_9ROSA|nr:hypothetical protein L484_001575 [Morus notabilis]